MAFLTKEPLWCIIVMGFNFLDCKEYHSSYSVIENDRHDRLTDKPSIHIFELSKVPKEIIKGNIKQQWMGTYQG